jgi:hypothetical protein
VPGLVEPIAPELLHGLRAAAGELKATHRRQRFPARLHVGLAGGAHVAVGGDPGDPVDGPRPDDPSLDDALRLAVLRALLCTARSLTGQPMVWLTRPGPIGWHDLEAAWLGPAHHAFAEAGLPLILAVVTKHGWYDPRSGVGRSWTRLRLR